MKKAEKPKNSKKKKLLVRRTLHYYWVELKKYKGMTIGMFLMTPIVIFIRGFLVTLLLSQIIDEVSTNGGTFAELWGRLWVKIVVIVVAHTISSMVLEKLRLYWCWNMEVKAMSNLGVKSFESLERKSMQFHNNKFGGSLVSATTKFVRSFERFVDEINWNVLPMVSSIIFTAIIMWSLAPWYVVFMLGFVVAYALIAGLTYKKISHISEEEAEAENKQVGQLADSITNILAVKSYGQEKYERKRFVGFTKAWANKSMEQCWGVLKRDIAFGGVYVGITVLLIVVLLGGSIWFGVTVGTMVLIVTYTQQITISLWDINNMFRAMNRVFGDAYEMVRILDEPDEVVDADNAKDLIVSEGTVMFDRIAYSHKDSPFDIFTDFSLTVKAGERVGLVGVSGSGKTTLTKLLLRFADVQSGNILIDGQNITGVKQVSLRENIAYVPQETALFHRTIAENIAYGKPDATLQEIKKAALLANADEFIRDLPNGYDTLVGERGVKLSGGQRQRIAIARAILKDAPILVLDEATSALDSESEAAIQEALIKLMKGRTSLVIAHRLSTVASLDQIVVLTEGRIVEQGSHEELLESNGAYAKLWKRQSGGFLESSQSSY